MDLRDLVKLAGIVNPELLNRIEPSQPDCGCGVEEADGAGFEDTTTRPDPEVMDDPMATYGSDVDLSLRRYLKAKGDHVTVDEDVYPDFTVEDVNEAYAAFKEGYHSKKKKKYNEESVNEASCGCGSDCGHCGGKHAESEVGKKCDCCGNMIKEGDEANESVTEGRMKDSVIHDSETMSKAEFAKKHGKEMADEYYESVEEAKMPDHPDIDDDGDTEEDITKAAEDKKKADESVDYLKKLAGL